MCHGAHTATVHVCHFAQTCDYRFVATGTCWANYFISITIQAIDIEIRCISGELYVLSYELTNKIAFSIRRAETNMSNHQVTPGEELRHRLVVCFNEFGSVLSLG